MMKRYAVIAMRTVESKTGKTCRDDPQTAQIVRNHIARFHEAAMFGLHLRQSMQLSTLTLEQQLRLYYQDILQRELM